jgi:hypothetical protein
MRAGYGEKLRRFLAEQTTLETVIDFGDLPVFDATAYPCIVVARRIPHSIGHQVEVLSVSDLEVLERLEEEVPRHAWRLPIDSLRPVGWMLESPDVLRLVKQLQAAGTPLEEVVEGHFYRGIVTGLNNAFVIDEVTRQKLINEDPNSAEIIRPWLRGRDVKRWSIDWAGLHLIYAPWSFPLNRYPAIKTHLERFRDKLSARPEVKEGRFPWYVLSRYGSEYAHEFDGVKIVYPHFNTNVNFALDDANSFSNDKTYIIPTHDLCLLGVLNSKITEFVMRHLSPSVQQGYMEFRTIYVGYLPIPDAPPTERQAIERLVRKLLDLRGEGEEVPNLEAELNERVYRLFGLTRSEIALIEQRLGEGA